MAELKIDDLEISAQIQGAIIAALSSDARERIIAEGIRHLTTRDMDRYGGRSSLLEALFE